MLHYTIHRVWEAISSQKEIPAWFIQADFEAVEGRDYTFRPKDEDNSTAINSRILKAKPTTELIYSWIVEGANLRLEHWGISNYPEESVPAMFTSFNGGWDACIKDLMDSLQKVNA